MTLSMSQESMDDLPIGVLFFDTVGEMWVRKGPRYHDDGRPRYDIGAEVHKYIPNPEEGIYRRVGWSIETMDDPPTHWYVMSNNCYVHYFNDSCILPGDKKCPPVPDEIRPTFKVRLGDLFVNKDGGTFYNGVKCAEDSEHHNRHGQFVQSLENRKQDE